MKSISLLVLLFFSYLAHAADTKLILEPLYGVES